MPCESHEQLVPNHLLESNLFNNGREEDCVKGWGRRVAKSKTSGVEM